MLHDSQQQHFMDGVQLSSYMCACAVNILPKSTLRLGHFPATHSRDRYVARSSAVRGGNGHVLSCKEQKTLLVA